MSLTKVAAGIVASETLTRFRNRVINGDMKIDQRFAGTTANVTAAYSLDRWKGLSDGAAVITHQQSTTVPSGYGFINSLKLIPQTADTSIAAGDDTLLRQNIEGFNFADAMFGTANAKTVTLSFWVRSSNTGTYCTSLINSAGNRSYVKEYTINSVDTWEFKTITFPGDTTGTWIGGTNGIGVKLNFTLACGSTYQTAANTWTAGNYFATSNQLNWTAATTNTFYITGIQLEMGSQATQFEFRNFGEELALCQRYYEKSYSQETIPGAAAELGCIWTYMVGASFTQAGLIGFFKVHKRTIPSMIYFSPVTGASTKMRDQANAADITANPQRTGQDYFSAHGSFAAGSCYLEMQWVADAEL